MGGGIAGAAYGAVWAIARQSPKRGAHRSMGSNSLGWTGTTLGATCVRRPPLRQPKITSAAQDVGLASGCTVFASPIFGSTPGLGFVMACFFAGVECQSCGRSSATQGAECAFWGVGGHPMAFVVQRCGSVVPDTLGMLVRAAERRATNRCGVW